MTSRRSYDLDPGDPTVRALARQESLNGWSDAVGGLTCALSYAKTWTPPADIPGNYVSVDEFIRRAAELLRIARGWRA